MKLCKGLLLILIGLGLCVLLHPNQALSQSSSPQFPMGLAVPIAPTPFHSDGKVHLVYELHVNSFRAGDVMLAKLRIFGDKSTEALASYQDAELEGLLGRPGTNQQLKVKRLIGPGMRAVVFLWLTLDRSAGMPTSLRHQVTFKLAGSETERVLEGARISVAKEGPIVIGPPMRGYGWVARFVTNAGFHRRGYFPVNGYAVISQRFAIDWGKFNEDGKVLRSGDSSKNLDFYIYGEEVIAVGDGVVASMVDGIPENDPSSGTTAVPVNVENASGNHVVLELDREHYALYGHLQPGSIRVKPGERVKRGQVLGRIGNSGNSVGPHLHFHISNSPARFEGEGLPYVFKSFDLWAHETPEEFRKAEGTRPKSALKAERRNLEFPSDGAILSFP